MQIDVRSGTLRFPLPGSVVASLQGGCIAWWASPGYVRLYSGTLEPGVHQICAGFEKATKISMRSSALSLLLAICPFHIALTVHVNVNILIRGMGLGMGMSTWSQSMSRVLHFGCLLDLLCCTYVSERGYHGHHGSFQHSGPVMAHCTIFHLAIGYKKKRPGPLSELSTRDQFSLVPSTPWLRRSKH